MQLDAMQRRRPIARLALIVVAELAGAAGAQTTTTQPATRPAGDWFAPGASATQPSASADASFAALYPRLAAADAALRAVTPRVVYNGLGTKNVPPTLRLPRMEVSGDLFTEASQRAYTVGHPRDPWKLVPDERRVRIRAIEAGQRNAALCLDIEALPLDARNASDAEVDRSVRTIAQMAGWARGQDPSMRLFLYAATPSTETYLPGERAALASVRPADEGYAWWQAQRPRVERAYAAWQASNARLRAGPGRAVALADQFDGVCPSLYLQEMTTMADAAARVAVQTFVWQHLDEARLYGRPVYPFVWPHVYEKREYVPLRQWVTLLREIMLHADGVILWDDPANGWDYPMSLRVRVAMVLAAKRGAMTDREVHDALQDGFAGYREMDELLAAPAAARPTTQQATQQTK